MIPPATLRVADCELAVRGTVATVTRGQNVLTVSGAHLYVAGATLVLVRGDTRTADLRTFSLADKTTPKFGR